MAAERKPRSRARLVKAGLVVLLSSVCLLAIILWAQRAQQPSTRREYVESAHRYMQDGQYEQAIDAITEALERTPSHDFHNLESAYSLRAMAHQKSGAPKLALKDINEAITIQPDKALDFSGPDRFRNFFLGLEAQKYMIRAQIYIGLKKYESAISDLDRVIELQENNHAAYWLRGEVHRDRGRYRKAIDDYDRALTIEPRHLQSLGGRANAYFELGKYHDAISDLNKIIETKPDAGSFYGRGLCFHKLGLEDKAKRDLEKAREMDSTYEQKTYE